MNKFEEELCSLVQLFHNKHYRYNTRLLSKEASIYFFLKNSKECVEKYNTPDKCVVPDNLEEIANELFSLDNVYVALTPCEDYFDKEGEYVQEFPTVTKRSLDCREVINDVKGYLEKGAVVYMYTYYCLIQDFVRGESFDRDIKTYWWRIISKIEKK